MALAGCGPVQFVRSPYSIRDLNVTYSVQEDVTLFSWRLGANVDPASVQFESWSQGEWRRVRFEEAPFPAGAYGCGQDTCFRLTIPGRFAIPESGLVLRSIHAQHGTQHAAPVSLDEREVTLSFAPHLLATNERLDLGVDDFLSVPNTPLRRSFRWSVTPSAESCVPSGGAWDGKTAAGKEQVPFGAAPTDEGAWCVTISPDARGIEAVSLAASVLAHPQLAYRTHRYVPEKQTAPLVYQLILDLEIPNENRCRSTLDLLEQGFAKAFRDRSSAANAPPAVKLPTVNLSSVPGGCRQEAMRRLPVADVAEAAKAYVRTAVQESEGTRLLFIYANNLAFPLPPLLTADFDALKTSVLEEPRAGVFLSAWAFPVVLMSADWQEPVNWIPPTDRLFGDTVKAFADSNLPFLTMLHHEDTTVAFVDPALEARDGLLKLCSSTPRIRMVDSPLTTGGFLYGVGPGHDVRYQVDFPEQWLVRNAAYEKHEAKVSYEVCTRWCSHPFRTPLGVWVPSWEKNPECGEGS